MAAAQLNSLSSVSLPVLISLSAVCRFFTCGVTKLLPILEQLDLEPIDLE